MKRILVIQYSQSGQLFDVVQSIIGPLRATETNTGTNTETIDIVFETLKPVRPFPFPWGFTEFFNTFPETVLLDPPPMLPLTLDEKEYESFDLILLAYQVWFLSPSLPVTGFLKSAAAKKILGNKPVITIIGCRNMWLMAQEKLKTMLSEVGAKHIGNIVLTDASHTALSFISTPLWMFTGKKGPFGPIPPAGISQLEITQAARFGNAIKRELEKPESQLSPTLLQGLKAVAVNENFIASEKVAQRSFYLWSKLLRACGDRESPQRKMLIYLYVFYLVTLILTFLPISVLVKKLFKPFAKKSSVEQRGYYAAPSGEADFNMDQI